METENRFDPLANGSWTKASQTGSDKNKVITGLKFVSINTNSIRGKKLELLAFLDFHQSQIVAIQETKIDSSISTSELFPESCPYNVYRKDRTLDGGGIMLLIHKDISHMPITELENDSESVWVKVFANKTSHFVASWYRPPGGDLEKLDSQLKSLEIQLEKIKDIHKGNKPPSVHILGDFNFCDIVWPDRLSKSGSPLSLSEGVKFIEILNDHHLEQLVHFPTREKNTLDLINTSLPSQFLDIQSPDRLSDTSFIQDSADKHIPSKTSRPASSVPWITPAIRRKIRRKNATHAKAKMSGSAKIRAKFETLRREIKADIRKQHDLYVNNLVGDV